jgi:SAM-dependent methyltransferase
MSGIEKQNERAPYVFGGSDEHSFWECSTCGLVYLYPLLTAEQESKFYAQEFEKFMETRAGTERDWSGPEAHVETNQDQVKRRSHFLKDSIEVGADILELGCSSGFMLDYYVSLGANVIGIEPSGGFAKFLAAKNYSVFESLDDLQLEMPNKKFDLITHFFVMEHVADTAAFIQSQLDMLKSNGKIILEIPCVLDPLTSLYNIPAFEKFYWSIAHHYYFSPESISRILDRLDCKYHLVPEQRYDMSNHLTWSLDGVPGGQGRFNSIFSEETLEGYKKDLIESGHYDTLFIYIENN